MEFTKDIKNNKISTKNISSNDIIAKKKMDLL